MPCLVLGPQKVREWKLAMIQDAVPEMRLKNCGGGAAVVPAGSAFQSSNQGPRTQPCIGATGSEVSVLIWDG